MADKKIKVKLVKSTAGCKTGHVATVRGLGLRRMNHVVELVDTPEVRGMINRRRHTGPGGIYIPPPSQWFK